MHAVTVGLSPNFIDFSTPDYNTSSTTATAMSGPLPPNMGMDPLQLQQLMQLLASGKPQPQIFVPPTPAAAAAAPKQTAVVECPKSMVGRVIGKGGETIKALQQYTGAMIQIDQSTDPTRVTIAGSAQSLQLAVSMVSDIVRGTFKGFAMLRQIAMATGLGPFAQPQPVYVQGYGFVPPSQVFAPGEEGLGGAGGPMLRSPPSGPLTPPITPLRANDANNLAGTLPPETLAALLGGTMGQNMIPPPRMAAPAPVQQQQANTSAQDALITQLLNQLVFNNQQQQQQQQQDQQAPHIGQQSGLDQGALQAFLAAQSGAGFFNAGQTTAPAASASAYPPSTSLMLPAGGQYGEMMPTTLGSFGSSGNGGAVAGTSAPHSSGTASPSHSLHDDFSLGAHIGGSPPRNSPILGGGFTSLSSAANPHLARRPASGESSPLGLYGAIGSKTGGSSAPASAGSVEETGVAAVAGSVGSPGLGSPIMSPVHSNPWDNNNGHYGH
jgi:rRNA processing protein Krr1/Pno1